MNSCPAYCRWVKIFDKEDLKLLIYLGYRVTKHWKCLVCEKDAKANIEAEEVRRYFVNPKIENEVFS